MTSPAPLPQVITFYSYKGGTGRTMALANVACLLAQRQEGDVLMVDWDLEAPGLHRYFRGRFSRYEPFALDVRPGLIDLCWDLQADLPADGLAEDDTAAFLEKHPLDPYVVATDVPSLHLLKAGRFDADYRARVNTFDWEAFYGAAPWLFRDLADQWTARYRYVLIDSRTGQTDTSGVCTMLMPEKLVVVFTPNRQSLTGVLDLLREATAYRQGSDDLRPLVTFPLPSRIEQTEPRLRDRWRFGDTTDDLEGYQPLFERAFRDVYALPSCTLQDYFDQVQIQHVPPYAYGEPIAVLTERGSDRLSLTRSYQDFSDWLLLRDGPWGDLQPATAIPKVVGAERDLIRRAERVLAQLTPDEQQAARRVLTRLVHVADPADGLDDVPRRASRAELEGVAAPSVVQALLDAHVIAPADTSTDQMELGHDALLRVWPRLRQWIDEDRPLLLRRQQVQQQQKRWTGQDDRTLILDAPLAEATELLQERPEYLTEAERTYIARSSSTAERRQRRAWVTGGALALVGVLIGFFGITYVTDQQQRADASALLADATLLAEQEPHRLPAAMLLALEAQRLSPEVNAEPLLQRGLALLRTPVQLLTLDPVQTLAISPDGRYVAHDGPGDSVHVWGTAEASRRVSFGLGALVHALAFAPDGLLATGTETGIRLYDVAYNRPVDAFDTDQPVRSVTFARDGNFVIAGTATSAVDGGLYAYPVGPRAAAGAMAVARPDPIPVRRVQMAGRPTDDVDLLRSLYGAGSWRAPWGVAAVAAGAQRLAYGGASDTVYVARADGQRALRHEGAVTTLAFDGTGRVLASGTAEGAARIWRTDDGVLLQVLLHDASVRTVAFVSDSPYLITGTGARAPEGAGWLPLDQAGLSPGSRRSEGAAHLWRLDGEPTEGVQWPLGGPVDAVAASQDGRWVALGGPGGAVLLPWEGERPDEGTALPGSQRFMSSATVAPTQQALATWGALRDGVAGLVWELTGPEPAQRDPYRSHTAAAFSTDASLIATGRLDGTRGAVEVRDVPTDSLLLRWPTDGPVYRLAFDPTGRYLAAALGPFPDDAYAQAAPATAADPSLVLYDVLNQQRVGVSRTLPAAPTAVAVAPGGIRLAVALRQRIALLDPRSPAQPDSAIMTLPAPARDLTFSTGGGYLAIAFGNTLRVADVASGNVVFTDSLGGPLNAVAFSPNGVYVAAGGDDRSAKVWSLPDGRQRSQHLHADRVLDVAFSPDGERLITAAAGRTPQAWIWDRERLAEFVCGHVTGNLSPAEWTSYLPDETYRATCPDRPAAAASGGSSGGW